MIGGLQYDLCLGAGASADGLYLELHIGPSAARSLCS